MDCPACGHFTVHSEGSWHCVQCDWSVQPPHSHRNRRQERRYKKVLRRLDKIGSRLAGVK